MNSDAQSWSFSRAFGLGAALGMLALLVWLLIVVKSVVLLAMLAGLLAVLFDGGVRFMRQFLPIPRWSALLTLALTLVAVVFAATLLLSPRVAADINALSERIPQALLQLEETVRGIPWGRESVAQLLELQGSANVEQAFGRFLGFFSSVLGVVTGTLVVLVLGIFIASEPKVYVQGVIRLLPPASRARGGEIASAVGRGLRWWLIGRFASIGLVFVFTWIGLLLLDVPLAFLLALIAGLLSFVPTFGPLVGAIPAVLVGLSAGPQQALWVALLYLGIQVVESYGVTPLIQRRTVRLPPALLVLFQLVMAVLAGVLGVLLATPILVVLMVLVGTLYQEDRLGETTDLP